MAITKQHFEFWVEWLHVSRLINEAWRPSHGFGEAHGVPYEASIVYQGQRLVARVNIREQHHDRPEWRQEEAMRLARSLLEERGVYQRGPLEGVTDPKEALERLRESTLRDVAARLPSSVYVDERSIIGAT